MLQVANFIFEETPQLADAVHDDNLQVLEWRFVIGWCLMGGAAGGWNLQGNEIRSGLISCR